jgi:hypothetical protein
MRILLVCDEPSLRIVLGALLGRNGHEVEISRDMESAKLRLQAEEYEMVLLNLVGSPTAPLTECLQIRKLRPDQTIAYIHGPWTGFPLGACPNYLIAIEEGFEPLLKKLEEISEHMAPPAAGKRRSGAGQPRSLCAA